MAKILSKKKIALLEFTDEAKAFLAECQRKEAAPTDWELVALSPEVQVFLRQRGLPFRNTLPFFSNDSHRRLLLQSEEWYRFLAEKVRICDDAGEHKAYTDTFLFYIRLLFHHFLFIVELLSNMTKASQVESLHAYEQGGTIESQSAQLVDDERYLGGITKAFANNRGLLFAEIPLVLKRGYKRTSRPGWSFSGYCINRYKNFVLERVKNKRCILITTKTYNLGDVALKLKADFPDIEVLWACLSEKSLIKHFFDSLFSAWHRKIIAVPVRDFDTAAENLSDRFDELASSFDAVMAKLQGEWRDRFTYEGLNFFDFFANRVNSGIRARLAGLVREERGIKTILDRSEVKLVISPSARNTALLLAELASAKEIPRLMISHGTLAEPKNRLEEIEGFHLGESLILSNAYNIVALQTPNEEKVYQHFHPFNRPVRTGPLIFSRVLLEQKADYLRKIIGKVSPGTKILLYPENTRLRSNLRFQVFETFDEFLSSCTDLIEAINHIDSVHLVIRLHPGKKISPKQFKELLPASTKLTVTSFDYPFYQALTIADLLVNFSSTVIEDALQNHIPVLLYDRWNRYMHFEAQQLSSDSQKKPNAVYYINDRGYLRQGIEWILENHLNQKVSESIFNSYVYSESQRESLTDFIRQEVLGR